MPRTRPLTYVTDLSHFDGVLEAGSTAPAPAKRLAKFLDDLVRISSREAPGTIRTDVRCFKKPAHKKCPGMILTSRRRSANEISWECPSCGNNGVIRHWQGSKADLSRYARPDADLQRRRGGVADLFDGTWRITSMEHWEQDDVDLLGPGFIRFEEQLTGELQFIAVRGWLDCRYGEKEGRPFVEFSWQGNDEGADACGRGWAGIERDGRLVGRIFIHQADDSSFTATKG